MPTSVLVTDRKVYNKYGNGDSFNINLGEFATYLRGGVMNVQKAVYTVEVTWFANSSTTNGVDFSITGNKLFRNIGSWLDDGLAIGDTIDLDEIGVGFVFTDRLITNITETLIVFDGAAPGDATYTGAIVYGGKTDLFALEYSYGIIENTDEATYTSLLDGADQTFYAGGIGIDSGGGRDTSFVDLQPKSPVRSWFTSRAGATRVRYVDRPSTYVQRFEIEHEYIIKPYNDDDLFTGNLSLKYISKFDFRTVLANLNTSKIAEDDIQLGSVGNFNENYDGYDNDFSIANLVYTDVATASNVTELNIKSKTRVDFEVNSATGLFNTSDPIVAFHSFMPTADVYSNKTEDYRDIWLYNSIRNEIDGGVTASTIITNVSSTFVNANQITVQLDVEFTPTQQLQIEEGDTYRLAIEVGDGDTANQTNNVTLLIEENTYSKDANITDLIISDEFGFNSYNDFISPTVDLFETYKGWIEDEIVSYHRVAVNRTASKDAEILGGRFKVIAYEDATGETFDLQSEDIDLSAQLNAPAGTINANPWTIQLIDDNRTRGYRLPDGDEFNLLLFETDDNDGTYQYYEYRVGFKMNWQYWIALPNADAIFINTADTFNGLNNRASNYSLQNGWSIRVQWQFDMQGIDDEGTVGETEYNFYTDQFEILDFDEQDDDPTTWNCEIFTFDESDNNLGGAVLDDEYTKIKAIFTPSGGYVIGDAADFWGELRIAEENQPGFNNDVLTTTKPYLDNNRLIPLSGETQATLTLVANTLELDARADFNQLKQNINYKLSAKLLGDTNPPLITQWTFKTENLLPTDAPFDPSMTTSGGETPTWELIEGYSQTTTSFTKSDRTSLGATELDGTCQNVVVTFSTNDPTNITSIDANNDQLCETLDLSLFTNVDNFRFQNNNITGVTFPISSNLTTILYFDNNNINGVLDLTNFTNLSGDLRFNNNSITSILLPISSNLITFLYLDNNNISGALDLSNLTNLSNGVRLQNNSITSVNFGNTTSVFTQLTGNNNNISGSLDLSPLEQLGGFISFHTNSITSVTFPSSSTSVVGQMFFFSNNISGNVDLSGFSKLGGQLRFENNNISAFTMPISTPQNLSTWQSSNNNHDFIDLSIFPTISSNCLIFMNNNVMSVSSVNQVLIDLDAVLGVGTGTINLSGQTPSAAPTGAGATAKTSLQGKGYTVTTD